MFQVERTFRAVSAIKRDDAGTIIMEFRFDADEYGSCRHVVRYRGATIRRISTLRRGPGGKLERTRIQYNFGYTDGSHRSMFLF